MTRAELLTMLHVLGTIAWLGGGIALVVLHWLALRAQDHQGLATVVRQSQTLGTWQFDCFRLPAGRAGQIIVMGRDEDERRVLAPDIVEYLTALSASALDVGEVQDGRFIWDFTWDAPALR